MTTPIETALREELAVAKAKLELFVFCGVLALLTFSLGFDAVARERNDARARVGELEATLRKCREATAVSDAGKASSTSSTGERQREEGARLPLKTTLPASSSAPASEPKTVYGCQITQEQYFSARPGVDP